MTMGIRACVPMHRALWAGGATFRALPALRTATRPTQWSLAPWPWCPAGCVQATAQRRNPAQARWATYQAS